MGSNSAFSFFDSILIDILLPYRWKGAEQDKTNKNLPPDKQFLVTRGVPCEKRIADLQKYHEDNAQELEIDAEDGWVETINPE